MSVRANAAGDFLRRSTDFYDMENFSICMWARLRSDLNTFSPVWLMGRPADNTYQQFGTNADGTTIVFEDQRPASADKVITMVNMTVDTWYFLAATSGGVASSNQAYWSSTTTGALSNGSISMSGTNTHSTAGTREMDLFEETLFGGRSDASVCAFKLWSGAVLTSAEFENERLQYLPVRTANLFTWSPFTDNDETNFRDYSGNARDWTEGGTVTFEDGPPISWGRNKSKRIYVLGGAAETITMDKWYNQGIQPMRRPLSVVSY